MQHAPRTRVVDLRTSPYDVYCGRPREGEAWDLGNPFGTSREGGTRALVLCKGKDEAVARFAAWLRLEAAEVAAVHAVAPDLHPPAPEEVRDRLAGRTLGCFCGPKSPCHARVLAHVAEGGEPAWPLPERAPVDPLPDATAAADRTATEDDAAIEAALLRGGRRLIALDIETSVETGEPACLTWAELVPNPGGVGWTVLGPFGIHARDPRARALFEGWLHDPDAVLLGQNVAFDLYTLAVAWSLLGEVAALYEAGRVRDTMLRQRLIDIAWPARLVWVPEFERLAPRKFAPHALLGEVRIDEAGDDGGGSFGAKGGLDALASRHLGYDLSADKHGADAPRLRYGEMLEVPWAAWPRDFRRYALGDPLATLEVYLAQADAIDAKHQDPRERLPDLFDGDPADPLTPLVDEIFQAAAALPFQAMSARGLRSDRALVQRQRAELAKLAAWAEDLTVEHGVARREPVYAPLPPGVPKVRRKKGEPAPEREVERWEVKTIDEQVRTRVAALLRAKGLPIEMTKSGKKIKADADTVFAAVDPTLGDVEGAGADAWSDAAEDLDPAERATADLSRPGADPQALADLSELLGPKLLKVARRALAGEGGWSLDRLRRAVEAAADPGLAALAVARKATKFDTSFLRGLDTDDDLRAWFRTMMDTGRTSMVGRIRQNMPKSGGIRECVVPRPGYVFLQCDYSQIELLGLATALDWCVGHESTLTRAIRDGVDCHLRLACHPVLELGEDYEAAKAYRKLCSGVLEAHGSDRARAEAARPDLDWARFDRIEKARQNAKAANFGFPGGMGAKKFVITCKKQGIHITLEQAERLREAWLSTWVEVRDYFGWASSLTNGGRSASVRHFDGGHWRGGCGYTQACNTLFQGLVARGAKLAAWALFVACYLTPDSPLYGCRPVLFVHDEFVLECPSDRCPPPPPVPPGAKPQPYEPAPLRELIRIMVEQMRVVMPGQAVKAEGKVLRDRWTK